MENRDIITLTFTLILSQPTPRLRQAGHQGRGSNIGKYRPYNNFPSHWREGIEGRGI